jgi:hypothetical protein
LKGGNELDWSQVGFGWSEGNESPFMTELIPTMAQLVQHIIQTYSTSTIHQCTLGLSISLSLPIWAQAAVKGITTRKAKERNPSYIS